MSNQPGKGKREKDGDRHHVCHFRTLTCVVRQTYQHALVRCGRSPNVQDAGEWDNCSNAHTTKVYTLWLNTILPCTPTTWTFPPFCVFILHCRVLHFLYRYRGQLGYGRVGSLGDKLQCDMDCGDQKVKLVSSSVVTRCWTYSSRYLSQCVLNNNFSYLTFIVVY